jgi:hypothetical protein
MRTQRLHPLGHGVVNLLASICGRAISIELDFLLHVWHYMTLSMEHILKDIT